MKFTHHPDLKTFTLLLKTSKSGEDPSVSCFPGHRHRAAGVNADAELQGLAAGTPQLI